MNEIRVLHFEDFAADRLFAAASLSRCTYARFAVQHVARLEEGLSQLAKRDYDAILLDLGLPDSQGPKTFELVHRAAPETPILVLTGHSDDTIGRALIKAGAGDYLPKRELSGGMLARSIHYAIERKGYQLALREMALHDPLTRLENRTSLRERARQVFALCERGGCLALCYIDLDGFKVVNDTLGHKAGDILLQTIAGRLRKKLRPADTLARLGGDEFVVLAPGIRGREDAILIAKKLIAGIAQPVPIAEQIASVTASVGIALVPEHARDFSTALEVADAAMYRSKLDGKNRYTLADRSKSAQLDRPKPHRRHRLRRNLA